LLELLNYSCICSIGFGAEGMRKLAWMKLTWKPKKKPDKQLASISTGARTHIITINWSGIKCHPTLM
jgi:hypothetical protein